MKCFILIVLLMTIIIFAGCTDKESIYAIRPTSFERDCGGVSHTVDYWGHGLDGKECCGRTLYTKQSEYFVCCGEKYIDYLLESCCDGIVFNRSNQHCCDGKVETGGLNWQDCGGQCYDSNTQHCCNGKVESGGGTWYICGDKCYDPYTTTRRCCNDNQIFDFATQSCCVVHEGDKEYTLSSPGPIRIIHDGQNSCCVGRPSQINGTFCQPNSGKYASPDGGSGCNTFECSMQKNWRDQESNRQVGRALGLR